MPPYNKVQRASIAELTPPSEYLDGPEYVCEILKIISDFKDIKTSWGIEVFSQEDFHDWSPKYHLTKSMVWLCHHDDYCESEIHLNDDALKDIFRAKTVKDSKIAQTLATLWHHRTIFNLEADFSEKFNPARFSELQFFLRESFEQLKHPLKKAPLNKKHTTVLKFNNSTSEVVKSALQHYATKTESILRQPYDFGLMFCTENPTDVSYMEFKSPEKYDCNYGLIPEMSYEHCGKLGPYNIYDALTQMSKAGIRSKKVTTRGGVMKGGETSFAEVRKFLSEIRLWQQDYCVEGIWK